MKKVKITVLRKEFYEDLAKEYLTDGGQVGSCALLNVGDTFPFEGNAQMPEGFCPLGMERYLSEYQCHSIRFHIYALEPQGRADHCLLYGRHTPCCI